MKKNYEIPECEEINVRIDNNFLTTMIVDPADGEEE